jgi:tetratricopeptide (TPR) repeat protein
MQTTQQTGTPPGPPLHIPIKMRWLLLFITLFIGLQVIRYPLAMQNFLRADGLLALGQTDCAMDHYKRAILLDPDFDQAYSMLAWSHELKKDYAGAKEVFEESLTHAHEDEQIYLHYTVFLWKTGNFPRACEVSGEAMRIFPENRNVLRAYGNSLERCGRSQEAQRLWLDYLRKYPDDETVRNKIRKKSGDPKTESLRRAAPASS